MPETSPSETLADLRREIDVIDAEMHRLLMRRGEIIDRLISVKRTGESGSAFRPAREAEMMRRLLARHRGRLPLDTVESIWRVVISTFTYVQAPYRVHADASAGEVIRDVARFHFGFTVPYVAQPDAAAVIAAVAGSQGDLGLVPVESPGEWWRPLAAPAAPKVIARLPFVERADHPVAMPVFVVSKPPEPGAVSAERVLAAIRVEDWPESCEEALARHGGAVLGRAGRGADQGLSLLLSLPGRDFPDWPAALLAGCGARILAIDLVGSHAATGAAPAPGQTEDSQSP